jgi:hypothetical protein
MLLSCSGENVKGQIHWTLRRCPPALPWAHRIDDGGTEDVEGRLQGKKLELRGIRVSDADLLARSAHSLEFDPSSNSVTGGSSAPEYGTGRYTGSYSFLDLIEEEG